MSHWYGILAGVFKEHPQVVFRRVEVNSRKIKLTKQKRKKNVEYRTL